LDSNPEVERPPKPFKRAGCARSYIRARAALSNHKKARTSYVANKKKRCTKETATFASGGSTKIEHETNRNSAQQSQRRKFETL
jgi:hypothetical protein